MSGTPKLFSGPAYIAASAGNLYAGAGGNTNQFDLVRQIHLANVDPSVDQSCAIYKGATAGSTGGTELFKGVVPAGDTVDLYFQGGLKLLSTDFISGIATNASKVTCTILGDANIV